MAIMTGERHERVFCFRIQLCSKNPESRQGRIQGQVSGESKELSRAGWDKVLEPGCGTGVMRGGRQPEIAQCGQIVLSDLSAGMLEAAKTTLKAYDRMECRIIDIQAIPYEDAGFDFVIANMMLYHVPDLKKGLSEVRRVLKPGGAFCCATYGEHDIIFDSGIFELIMQS